MDLIQPKVCMTCGEILTGREGKKFCDNECRWTFNNRMAAKTRYSSFVRNITNALLRNRKILETFLQPIGETGKVSKEKLKHEGFQFKFFTHTHTTRANGTFFYCYEFGYLSLDDGWFLIVKRKDN